MFNFKEIKFWSTGIFIRMVIISMLVSMGIESAGVMGCYATSSAISPAGIRSVSMTNQILSNKVTHFTENASINSEFVSPIDFFNDTVMPNLAPEDVFNDSRHNWKHQSDEKWRGECLWHERGNSGTSFWVDTQSMTAHCPVCQVSMDPIQYRQKLATGDVNGVASGVEWFQHLEYYAEKVGVKHLIPNRRELSPEEESAMKQQHSRRELLKAAYTFFQQMLDDPKAEQARHYLEERGFTIQETKSLGLGYYSSSSEVKEYLNSKSCGLKLAAEISLLSPKWEGFITYPWYDEKGQPLTMYGRYQQKTPPDGMPKTLALGGKGSKDAPFMLFQALTAGHKDFVLLEGINDVCVSHAKGDTSAIACVGAQLSKGQVETLARVKTKTVSICLDPDGAGDNGTLRCIKMLNEKGIGCFVVPRLPDGLDPDEYILKYGITEWKRRVMDAEHHLTFQLRLIIEKYKGPSGWSDKGKAMSIREAEKIHESMSDKADEFQSYFGKAFTKETGYKFSSKNTSRINTQEEAEKALLAFEKRNSRLIFMAGDPYTYEGGVYKKQHITWLQNIIIQQLGDNARMSLVKDILFLIEGQATHHPDEFDSNNAILNFQNGLLALDSLSLEPHDRNYLSLIQMKVDHDPEATCEKWEQLVSEIFPENSERTFFQEHCGYVMSPVHDLQKFAIQYGKGENGKGVVNDVLSKILCPDTISALPLDAISKDRRLILELNGKRANFAGEMPMKDNYVIDDEALKLMSANDPITVDKKYTCPVTLRVNCYLVFSTNKLPKTRDIGHSMRRRIIILPFRHRLPAYVREFKGSYSDYLVQAEGSGIANWLIKGLELARKNKLSSLPVTIAGMVNNFIMRSDVLTSFIQEGVVFGKENNCKASDFYQKYAAWAESNGLKPLSRINFQNEILDRFDFVRLKKNSSAKGANYFYGLRTLYSKEMFYSIFWTCLNEKCSHHMHKFADTPDELNCEYCNQPLFVCEDTLEVSGE